MSLAEKDQFPGIWEWAGFVMHEEAPPEAFEAPVYDFYSKDPVSRLPESAEDWDPFGVDTPDLIEDFDRYIKDPVVVEKVQLLAIELITIFRRSLIRNRFSN